LSFIAKTPTRPQLHPIARTAAKHLSPRSRSYPDT
jgi:hypothetical protein